MHWGALLRTASNRLEFPKVRARVQTRAGVSVAGWAKGGRKSQNNRRRRLALRGSSFVVISVELGALLGDGEPSITISRWRHAKAAAKGAGEGTEVLVPY